MPRIVDIPGAVRAYVGNRIVWRKTRELIGTVMVASVSGRTMRINSSYIDVSSAKIVEIGGKRYVVESAVGDYIILNSPHDGNEKYAILYM